jgi:hypothetical protein
MCRHYYNASSLRRVLDDLEAGYGMSSEEFYEAHLQDCLPRPVPSFHRHVWASLYRDWRRLAGADFAENAERVLALG